MEWYWVLLIVISSFLLLLVIAFISLNYLMFSKLFKRGKIDEDFGTKDLTLTPYKPYIPLVKDSIAYLNTIPKQTLVIKSFDGLSLYGDYFNNNSDTTIIFFHGYNARPLNNFALVAKTLFDEGYNILLVTQRSHGISEGKYITFGINERKDVISWCNKINLDYNPKNIIIYGLSMGCATVAMSLELDLPSNVKAAVLDCGFKSIPDLLDHLSMTAMKRKSKLALKMMELFAKLFGKFDIYASSAIKSIENSKIPCFFLHGKDDNIVPFFHGEDNFNACKTYKDAIFIDNVTHARAFYAAYPDGKDKLLNFINYTIKNDK